MTGTQRDLRLAGFLVVESLCLVLSKRSAWAALGPWLDARIVYGALLPLLAAWALSEREAALGLGLGSVRRGVWGLAIGVPLAVLAVVLLAWDPAARAFYLGHPTSSIALTARYLPDMLQAEIAFRGALLFALLPRTGPVLAVALSSLPYGLYHFDKSVAEALGSVPVGLALAGLVLWTRSIWYGVAIHLTGSVALTLLAHAWRR